MNRTTIAERRSDASPSPGSPPELGAPAPPIGKPIDTGARTVWDWQTLRKVLLGCGVLSSMLYIAADVYAWTLYPGYDPVSQALSELLAEGAPRRPLLFALLGAAPSGLYFEQGPEGLGDAFRQCESPASL